MRYLEADAPLFMGNPYRFSGKERTLADYDFGARRYLPFRVPRWTSMDPMAEKYYSISPYAYCAADPVNLVDPEGMDYGVIIKEGKIIITATIYTMAKNSQYAQKGVSEINSLSGKFEYVVNGEKYGVIFNLNVEIVSDNGFGEKSSINEAASKNKPIGNTFRIEDDREMNSNENGYATGGRDVTVRDSRKETETVMHEFGHILGWRHESSGVMTPSSEERHGSKDVLKSSILKMLINAFKGIEPKDEKGAKLGVGTILEGNELNNKDFKKGKVVKK